MLNLKVFHIVCSINFQFTVKLHVYDCPKLYIISWNFTWRSIPHLSHQLLKKNIFHRPPPPFLYFFFLHLFKKFKNELISNDVHKYIQYMYFKKVTWKWLCNTQIYNNNTTAWVWIRSHYSGLWNTSNSIIDLHVYITCLSIIVCVNLMVAWILFWIISNMYT